MTIWTTALLVVLVVWAMANYACCRKILSTLELYRPRTDALKICEPWCRRQSNGSTVHDPRCPKYRV